MLPVPQTPPLTQVPASTVAGVLRMDNDGPKRHEVFYETSELLPDPVILRAGNVLYRLSRYYLMSGCEFFNNTFSIPTGDPGEGASDAHPVVLPVGSKEFDIYLFFDRVYQVDALQEELIVGIRLAQMWNVPHLFHYCVDHFKRQFNDCKVHPAVVLAVARANWIPSLIKPAVKALAEPDITFYSWGCEDKILRHTMVEEVGAIARMRERLYMGRLAILDVPPVTHAADCIDKVSCVQAWERYWHTVVGKKIRGVYEESISHQLWFIRSKDVLQAEISGMGNMCLRMTAERVAGNPCWFSDDAIINGAVEYLMVSEQVPDWPASGLHHN